MSFGGGSKRNIALRGPFIRSSSISIYEMLPYLKKLSLMWSGVVNGGNPVIVTNMLRQDS